MRHELKIEAPYAQAVLSLDKTFEVRYNDRGFQKGDTLKFICTETFIGGHRLERMEFVVTYVLESFGLEKGFCVLAIKPLEEARKL